LSSVNSIPSNRSIPWHGPRGERVARVRVARLREFCGLRVMTASAAPAASRCWRRSAGPQGHSLRQWWRMSVSLIGEHRVPARGLNHYYTRQPPHRPPSRRKPCRPCKLSSRSQRRSRSRSITLDRGSDLMPSMTGIIVARSFRTRRVSSSCRHASKCGPPSLWEEPGRGFALSMSPYREHHPCSMATGVR
jgi:hypothetical protein